MPTKKAPLIDALLTSIVGISRQDANEKGICTFCKKEVGPFRNAISKREYHISGFCQDCQDATFGVD